MSLSHCIISCPVSLASNQSCRAIIPVHFFCVPRSQIFLFSFLIFLIIMPHLVATICNPEQAPWTSPALRRQCAATRWRRHSGSQQAADCHFFSSIPIVNLDRSCSASSPVLTLRCTRGQRLALQWRCDTVACAGYTCAPAGAAGRCHSAAAKNGGIAASWRVPPLPACRPAGGAQICEAATPIWPAPTLHGPGCRGEA